MKTPEVNDLTNEETVQQICQYIDGNVFCSAEEHCRKLEHQFDRIETQQRHLKAYVEDCLDPVIIEIRNLVREMGNNHETKD